MNKTLAKAKKKALKKLANNDRISKDDAPAEEEQIDGTEKERQDAMHRAKMCMQEIQEVQNKWHCRISPTLNQPEWVGNGSKMIISATYAIEPLPLD